MSLDAGSEKTHSASSHRITWFSPVQRPVGGTIFVKPMTESTTDEQSAVVDAED